MPMFLVIMQNNDYHYFFKDREVCNIVKNMKRLAVKNMKALLPFQLQLQNDFRF